MKVTINIECTPAEAREVMGLPDIRPLQAAWLAEIEKRMMADMDRLSIEGLTRAWLSGASTSMDWLPGMFKNFLDTESGDAKAGETKK